jgi:signal transduction histidine kinase
MLVRYGIKFFFRQDSLLSNLFFVVGILLSLSVISALLGWYLLGEIREKQSRLTNHTLPVISAARSLASEAAAISNIAPQLIETTDLDHFLVAKKILSDHLSQTSVVHDRFQNLLQDDLTVRNLGKTVKSLKNMFERQVHYVSQQFDRVEQQKREVQNLTGVISSLGRLLTEKVDSTADNLYVSIEGLIESRQKVLSYDDFDPVIQAIGLNEAAISMGGRNKALLNLLEEVRGTSSAQEVGSLQRKIEFEVRQIIDISVVFKDRKFAHELTKLLDTFYRELIVSKSITSRRNKLVSLILEIRTLNGQIKEEVFELNRLARKISENAEKQNQTMLTAVESEISFGSNLLLATVLVTIIFSVFIIWYYLIRKIIYPIREIAGYVQNLNAGNYSFPVRSFKLVEFNELALALEVAQKNSAALLTHQQTLEDNNIHLARINDDLNAFVHVASHDLKTPLRGIEVLSEFIHEDIRQNKLVEAGDNLDLLKSRIKRLSGLLESLLVFTQSGMSQEKPTSVDLDRLVRDIFDLICADRPFKLVVLDHLPEIQVVMADMNLIFMNLFDNAIAHHDRKTGTVLVKFQQIGESYLFEIEDDGDGIEPQYHDKVFEALQTLKSRDLVEGAGLGLAQVKRLLDGRGGSISLVSDPSIQRGSRFIVQYPILEAE